MIMMPDKIVNMIIKNSFIICSLTMLYLRILADTGMTSRSKYVVLELLV
jgi:hypothetical protein